jgi:hypothetical protein
VGSAPREAATARRLSDLRRASAADTTLQNLLQTLGAKLDLCSRLPVFEYEAASEGHDESATLFRQLAESERDSFNTLALCLKHYLDDNLSTPGAGGQEANR